MSKDELASGHASAIWTDSVIGAIAADSASVSPGEVNVSVTVVGGGVGAGAGGGSGSCSNVVDHDALSPVAREIDVVPIPVLPVGRTSSPKFALVTPGPKPILHEIDAPATPGGGNVHSPGTTPLVPGFMTRSASWIVTFASNGPVSAGPTYPIETS